MASLSPPPTAWATAELQEALAGQYYVLPWRGPLASMGRSLVRSDGTWLGGVIIFLILAGILPLTFVAMSIFCMLAVATCLRAFALHEYARQLTELAQMQEGGEMDAPEDAAEGTGTAGVPGSSSPARRRTRAARPALLRAMAAAGRPLSLLNLRLSLVDRDFTDQDYQLLLRLDELEAGAASQPEPPPLPEDQLAQLPVHVHRTPTKKGRKLGGSTGFTPSSTPRKGLFPSGKGTGGSAAGREPAAPPGCVPVLVEQAAGGLRGVHAAQQLQLGSAQPPRPSAWGASGKVGAAAAPTAAADSAGSGGIKAARPTGPAAAGELGLEIVPAPAPLESEGSEAEEDEPLCSVCLEPFADGAKILSLPCKHQFHADCATQWLRYKGFHATCPNCKGQVFTPPANTPRA